MMNFLMSIHVHKLTNMDQYICRDHNIYVSYLSSYHVIYPIYFIDRWVDSFFINKIDYLFYFFLYLFIYCVSSHVK
jgi:hypothetical protein